MSFLKPRSSPSLPVLLVAGDGCRSCRYSEEHKKREEDEDMTPASKNDDDLLEQKIFLPGYAFYKKSNIAWRISFRENYITPCYREASL